MASQKRRYHFDKRKRRYVQLQPDETVQAGKRRRTDSGVVTKCGAAAEPAGLYKTWMRKSRLRVPAVGELADSKAPDAHDLSQRCHPHAHHVFASRGGVKEQMR
jgi:ATP-dependent RNA helicase DDX54/DBP10